MRQFFKSEITHGATGGTLAVAGMGIAMQLNAWLQTISLLLTIAIAVATLISIIRKWRSKGN